MFTGILTAIGLLISLALMVGMAIRKNYYTLVEYSSDWDGVLANVGTATWATIPKAKIRNSESEFGGEEELSQETLNGGSLQAAVRWAFSLAIALDDTDTFLNTWATSAAAGTETYLRVTQKNQDPVIVGPFTPKIAAKPLGAFGDIGVKVISGVTTGADVGDTYQIQV